MALWCSANNLALSSRERVGLTLGCNILTATALTGTREMNTIIKEAEEVQLHLMITMEVSECACARSYRCFETMGLAGYRDSDTH